MGVFSVQLSVADSLYTPAVTRNRLQIKAVTMALQHIDVLQCHRNRFYLKAVPCDRWRVQRVSDRQLYGKDAHDISPVAPLNTYTFLKRRPRPCGFFLLDASGCDGRRSPARPSPVK